jgi:putative ABC transport system permease protein
MDTGFKVLGWDYEGNWSFVNFHTYVRLRPGVEIASIASRFGDFVARHRRPVDSLTGMVATQLTDIHLSGRTGELTPPASRTELLAFGAVALCILLVACVNFMNLATARAAQRAREVGVRKALGAGRRQLVAQFVGEAVLCAAVAMLLAAVLVELVLAPFNAFADTAVRLDYLGDARVALTLVGFAAAVGLLAGSYPAFYLARFDPAKVLKGDATRGERGMRLRQLLVIGQFAVSIVLLIVTAVIHSQTEHARNVERGFNSEQIVVLSGSAREGLGSGFGALRARLLEHPEITHVVLGAQQPRGGGVRTIRAEGGDPAGRDIVAKGVDYGFFEAYDIPLVAGRTFSEERGTDRFVLPSAGTLHTTGSYVLNERAARELGWTSDEAVGKWLETEMGTGFSRSVRGPVVGVVKDIYFGSAREPLQAVVYFAAAGTWEGTGTVYFRDASVRVTGRRIGDTLAYIDAVWRELEPEVPLAREFLSDEFAALYRTEQRQAQLLAAFAALAVAIACLGLFGLASFTTGRRSKEIGIRKTLGGSTWDVLKLLTADFTKLVLLANVLAWPVAYVLAERWLSTFVYRVSLGPVLFAGSGLIALAVAWLTVAGVGLKAASAKPMGTLRHE